MMSHPRRLCSDKAFDNCLSEVDIYYFNIFVLTNLEGAI